MEEIPDNVSKHGLKKKGTLSTVHRVISISFCYKDMLQRHAKESF